MVEIQREYVAGVCNISKEEENRRLKQMYAELSLDHKVLKDIVEKKL